MIPIGTFLKSTTGETFSLDLTKHTSIHATTGGGKSALMERMAFELIQRGEGLIFLDPHGQSVDRLVANMPPNRVNDVIWYDAASSHPIGMNPLSAGTLLAAKQTLKIISNIWGENSWGPRSGMIAEQALNAIVLHVENPSLLHLDRFFTDEDFAKALFERVEDREARRFFETWRAMNDRDRENAEGAPWNKANTFTRSPFLRHIVGQTGLDLARAMNERKVILVRLSKSQLGEDDVQILGALFLAKILFAALERQKSEIRPFVSVFVDEFHNFTRGGHAEFILSETRKYNIALVTADQSVEGYSFSNYQNKGVGRISHKDSEEISGEFGIDPQVFVDMPNFEWYFRSVHSGIPSVSKIRALPPIPEGNPNRRNKIIERSKMYGVERDFLNFHLSETPRFKEG